MKDIASYAGQDSADLVEEPWVNLARQAQETLEEDITYLAWLAKLKQDFHIYASLVELL